MRGAESVVGAFLAPRKPGDAALLAQLAHLLAPPGEDLVAVGLVADIPDQPVLGRAENVMKRDGELDRSEVRRKVSAGRRHRVEDEGAKLRRHLRKAAPIELAKVRGVVDR